MEQSQPIKQNGYHNMKSLAAIYGVNEKTLKRRLEPIKSKIEAAAKKSVTTKKTGSKSIKVVRRWHVLNYAQLKLIVEYLGEPIDYKFTGKKFIPES